MNQEPKKVHNFRHPGSGRRRTAPHTKGRQVDPAAATQISTLIADRPLGREHLIEHLHLIQDSFGCLYPRHLAALAEHMHLALAEVYEVATFYAHFNVAKDDETPAPRLTIRVCDSLSCELAGAKQLLAGLPAMLDQDIYVTRAPCMGRCASAPTAEVGHRHIDHATPEAVAAAVAAGDTAPVIPAFESLTAYQAGGGYELLTACRAGKRSVDDIIAILDQAGLRGLGGAGFPAARKWGFVRAGARPRILAINADEGEPGTFKDRQVLEQQPHRFLEGMLIAAWGVEATEIYIYLRDEYPAAREILTAEIARIGDTGIAGAVTIHLRRGAGAYICGEESAMLESIEGKRGLPRNRPPYVAELGLFARPTLVHNVETVTWIRDIVERGAAWFTDQGRPGHKGPRSFSVSGRVSDPGVKLAPAGITLRQLIDDYCGGMAPGHKLKAYLPGGASGGILPASLADLPLDFGALEEHGCFIGSAAVIVLSHQDNMCDVALNLMRFFEDESCGQCTPCRVGTEKAVKLMARPHWDAELLDELAATMRDASICGLGQAAPNPLTSVFKYFPQDLRPRAPGDAEGQA